MAGRMEDIYIQLRIPPAVTDDPDLAAALGEALRLDGPTAKLSVWWGVGNGNPVRLRKRLNT